MRKIIFSFSIAAALSAPVFSFADHNSAHTIDGLRAQIQALQAQIGALRKSDVGQAKKLIPPVTPPEVRSVKPIVQPEDPVFDNDTSDDDIIQLNKVREKFV